MIDNSPADEFDPESYYNNRQPVLGDDEGICEDCGYDTIPTQGWCPCVKEAQ